jgi:hypothetical protein
MPPSSSSELADPAQPNQTPASCSRIFGRGPSLMYGVTVNPSNTTGRTGAPETASGGTGCTAAAILTLNVRSRASGSKSMQSTVHNGKPESLSRACTGRSLVLASKSDDDFTAPINPAPNGKTSPNSTLYGPWIAISCPPSHAGLSGAAPTVQVRRGTSQPHLTDF